jgi:hypothetical protein
LNDNIELNLKEIGIVRAGLIWLRTGKRNGCREDGTKFSGAINC